ncbi:hypothetical protein ACFLZR_00520 [Candidatus Neomarinimicrobiota bacterium]
MRSILIRALVAATAIMFMACAATQFTLYKPSESEAAWRVTVTKQPITDLFVCSINDSVVVEGSFGIFSDNFEEDGSYRNRSVKLAGYRAAQIGTGSEGQTSISYTYQIRVFINESDIGVFEF